MPQWFSAPELTRWMRRKNDGGIGPARRRSGAETSSDYATTTDVLVEVVENYQKLGREFSTVCYIYPTAPFVTAQRLREAYQLLNDSGADGLLPVTAFSYPPLRGLTVTNNRLRMKWPENTFVRSQDLEAIYHDSGQFCFIRTETLMRERNILCQNMVPMILPDLEVQDIDNETDWEVAELKYELLQKRGMLRGCLWDSQDVLSDEAGS
nr:pseudaminic acid cytidylyltransferase [uncultured Oscillibacter sp.]